LSFVICHPCFPQNKRAKHDPPASSESASASGGGGAARKKTFAERQMEKMGHQKGKGLGKDGQGMAEPVVGSGQIGVQGLGFKGGIQREYVRVRM
jgi:hypothetical protein